VGEWGFPSIGYDDADAAFALLETLMDHPGTPENVRSTYTRRALTARLAQSLDALTAESR
ncbi:MAG: hypothetical protein VX880_03465, partial [Bacteroidota bacterium]|nr:hypothetical protein [Bacteroidota bacterium]